MLLPLVVMFLGAAPAQADDSEVVVGRHGSGCTRIHTWSLQGRTTLGQVLEALSPLTCERFLITRELYETPVTIAVQPGETGYETRERVIAALRANGYNVGMERISVVEKRTNPSAALSIPPAPSSAPVAWSEYIRCDAKKECEIKAQIFEHRALSSTCRVVPSYEDGKWVGMKLYAIRPDSPAALIGLQNGDLVIRVNDRRLDSAEAMLEVVRQARSSRRLTVELIRRGESVTLHHRVK